MQLPRAENEAAAEVPLLAEHQREAHVEDAKVWVDSDEKSGTSLGCWCFGDYKDGFPSIAESIAEVLLPQWLRQSPAALGLLVAAACFGLFLLIAELQVYSQRDEGVAKLVRRLSSLSLFCGYSSLAASCSGSVSLLNQLGAVLNGLSALAAFALTYSAAGPQSPLASGAGSAAAEGLATVEQDAIVTALRSAAVMDARCLSRAAMNVLSRTWSALRRTAESPHQTASQSFFVWHFQQRDARFWAFIAVLLVIGSGLGYALALIASNVSHRTGPKTRLYIQTTGVIAAGFFVACAAAAILQKKCHLWLLEASVVFSLFAAGPELLQATHRDKTPADIEVASTV